MNNSNKIAINNGVIAFLVITVYNIMLIIINPEIAFSLIALLGVFALIISMILALRKIKKVNDNILTFKEAFRVIFIISLIVAIGNILYTYLLLPIILPNYEDIIQKTTIAFSEKTMHYFNTPQEAIDQAIDQTMAKFEDMKKHKISNLFKTLSSSIISNSFIGVIISLIMKSKGEKANFEINK